MKTISVNGFLIILCFCGLLCSCGETASEAEGRARSMADIFNGIEVNYEQLLNCSDEDIVKRWSAHPLKSAISAPMHARKRWVLFSPEEARKLGDDIVGHLRQRNAFWNNAEALKRVGDIARRLRSQFPEGQSDRIFLLNCDEINALCLIDGTLCITRGALEAIKDDDRLGAIIAHEYGHAWSRHGCENLSKSILVTWGMKIASDEINRILVDDEHGDEGEEPGVKEKNMKSLKDEAKKVLIRKGCALLGKYGIMLPYSRIMEYEADILGMALMKKAGLNAEGAVKLMCFFRDVEKTPGKWTEFFSTHPDTANRLAHLEDFMANPDILGEALSNPEQAKLDWAHDAIEMLKAVTIVEEKCENPQGTVVFVPGIFMGEAESYLPHLKKAYTDCNLKVMTWKAMSKFSWKRASYRAECLSMCLCGQIAKMSAKEREDLILVGHSLGAKVIMGLLPRMEKACIQVRQMVIMGAAEQLEREELLATGKKACRDSILLLYKPDDLVLKYTFKTAEKARSIGLLGTSKGYPGVKEYCVPPQKIGEVADEEMIVEQGEGSKQDEAKDTTEANAGVKDKFNKPKSQDSHKATVYLAALASVRSGKILHDKCKVDCDEVCPKEKELKWPIPSKGGKKLETFHNWDLLYWGKGVLGFGIIRNPYGECCFYARKKEVLVAKFNEIKAKLDKQYGGL